MLVEATKTVTADLHLHANPLVLEFTGVGNFGRRVVFASIKEGESKERLAATAGRYCYYNVLIHFIGTHPLQMR